MPRITRVEPDPNRRDAWALQLDGEPWLTLPRQLAGELELREGRALGASQVVATEREVAFRAALDAALRALAVRQRSRGELERRLRAGGHGDDAIEAALARCEGSGYLDDRSYAAAFVRDRIRLRPRGLSRLRAELRRRGVSEEDAAAGIAEALDEEGTTEAQLLERAARRRWRTLRGLEPEVAKRRLAAYLMRRGFPPPAVWEAVRRLAGRPE